MKIRCPKCPNVILEFAFPIPERGCELLRCGNCGIYLAQFVDQLGVTYCSHYLTQIQEMRDETKETRTRIKSRTNIRDRTFPKRESLPPSTSDKSNPKDSGQIERTDE